MSSVFNVKAKVLSQLGDLIPLTENSEQVLLATKALSALDRIQGGDEGGGTGPGGGSLTQVWAAITQNEGGILNNTKLINALKKIVDDHAVQLNQNTVLLKALDPQVAINTNALRDKLGKSEQAADSALLEGKSLDEIFDLYKGGDIARPTALTTEDLDDITDGGYYKQTSEGYCTPDRNYPEVLTGVLTVTNTNSTIQHYQVADVPRTWFRTKPNGSTTWSDWSKVFTTSEPPTKKQIGLEKLVNEGLYDELNPTEHGYASTVAITKLVELIGGADGNVDVKIQKAIEALVGGASPTHNTLGELEAAIRAGLIDPNALDIRFAKKLNTDGVAVAAQKLNTARKITIDGDLGGEGDFDGSGDVTISTTLNPVENVEVVNDDESRNFALTFNSSGEPVLTDGTNYHILFGENGAFIAQGNIGIRSDERVKENLRPILSPTTRLLMLSGLLYHRTDTGAEEYGVLAQAVQRVFPEMVGTDSDGMLHVKYNGLIAVLLEAFREEVAERKMLTERVKNLEVRAATKH